MSIHKKIKNFFEQKNQLDEIGRPKYYTEEIVIEKGCEYKNVRDFKLNARSFYDAAIRDGYLLKIKSKCKYRPLGNLYNRMIYMYIWEKNANAVYFGLTCDEDRRYGEHTSEEINILSKIETCPSCKIGNKTGVKKFTELYGNFDRYVAISEYLPAELAASAEMCLIEYYRTNEDWKDNLIVVNRTRGGELGGRCSSNARKLITDTQNILKKYIKTSEEFEKIFPTAFKYWANTPSRKKLMNQNLNFRLFKDAPYGKNEILDIAKNYDDLKTFENENRKVFLSAKRKKMLDIIFPQDLIFYNKNNGEYFNTLKKLSENLNLNFNDLYFDFERNLNDIKHNIVLNNVNEINETKILIEKLLSNFL